MSEQHNNAEGHDANAPRNPGDDASSLHQAGPEAGAVDQATQDASGISRRTAILVGSAAAGTGLLPVEVVAGALATGATTTEFRLRLTRAMDAVNVLRDIRAELASCSARIMRMDPLRPEAREERWRESLLYFRQTEAAARAFGAANSISYKAPSALKSDARQLEIALTRYILYRGLSPAKPDWNRWSRKRQAASERWLAARAKRTTST